MIMIHIICTYAPRFVISIGFMFFFELFSDMTKKKEEKTSDGNS